MNHKTNQKRHIGTIIISVLLTIIIASGLWVLYCISLALTDHYKEQYTFTFTEDDDTFLTTLLHGTAFGKEFTVTEDEFNTFINKKYCKPEQEGKTGIDHIRFYFHENAPTEVYAHAYTWGKSFAIHAKVGFNMNSDSNKLTITLYDARVGELSVSNHILSWLIPQIFSGNEYISVDNNSLTVTAKYSYDIKNTSITMRLNEFIPLEGEIQCRTNSLTGEALHALGDYLSSDEGKQKLKDIYNNAKDKIRSWLEN